MSKKELVAELRRETEAPMNIIAKALKESNNNKEEAIKLIQASLSLKAKSKREETGEIGSTFLSEEEKYKGSLIIVDDSLSKATGLVTAIKIKTMTDFTTKNKDLIDFCDVLIGICSSRENIYTVEALLLERYNDDLTVKEKLDTIIGTVGENIMITNIIRISSNTPNDLVTFKHYNHQNKYFSMLCYLCKEDFDEEGNKGIGKAEKIDNIIKRLLNHIIFSKPLALKEGDLDKSTVAKEKDLAAKKADGKPAKAKDNIIKGAYNKFLDTACLDRQILLGDEELPKNERKTIRQYLDECKIDIIDYEYIV